MGRRQRLRILKRNPAELHVQDRPTTTLWRRPIRSAFTGSQSPFAAKPLRPKPRAEQQKKGDEAYLFRDVPAERRSSQASTTRLAMPASDNFPHARGSYAFLLPTSPSTFSTPS